MGLAAEHARFLVEVPKVGGGFLDDGSSLFGLLDEFVVDLDLDGVALVANLFQGLDEAFDFSLVHRPPFLPELLRLAHALQQVL